MTKVLYRGSVKNLHGVFQGGALVFEYSDAFSVFDWGRLPDPIIGKGAALAVMAASFFSKIQKPDTWREFSKSSEAQAL
ncbi:MAG: phosphoribosylaminoimidazolesuccinocarboxamide synthase, partial [Bdellovibrionota bacterium]